MSDCQIVDTVMLLWIFSKGGNTKKVKALSQSQGTEGWRKVVFLIGSLTYIYSIQRHRVRVSKGSRLYSPLLVKVYKTGE